MPPRIAIAACRKMPDYVESVRLAGGAPWPVSAAGDSPEAVVASCAGLLLTGGVDVAPERYDSERHPSVTELDPARDEFEVALVCAAIAADVPILAICRGMQVMNVAAGGSLIQDIPSQVGTAVPHQVPAPKDALAHDVDVVAGSRLAALMGGTVVDGRLPVNSRHHQAVRRLGAGFLVTATAPDGVVEAMERPQSRFCVAVQWHPENFVESRLFIPLFAGLVSA